MQIASLREGTGAGTSFQKIICFGIILMGYAVITEIERALVDTRRKRLRNVSYHRANMT